MTPSSSSKAVGQIKTRRVVHALEYQGSGHYLKDAAARDAVKKEALRRADIGYHEIVSGHMTPKELRTLVKKSMVEGEDKYTVLGTPK